MVFCWLVILLVCLNDALCGAFVSAIVGFIEWFLDIGRLLCG